MNLEILVNRLAFITSEITQNNQEHSTLNDYLFSDNNLSDKIKGDIGKEESSTGLLLQLERNIDRLQYEQERQKNLITKTKDQVYDFKIDCGPVSSR